MNSTHLRQQAYDYIQQRIVSGDLPPGELVSELSLAGEIGVSRTPVREAIRRLVHEGLLEQVPRFGTLVRSPKRQDIVELYELREALESFAAFQAAERISASELLLLDRLCDEIKQLGEKIRRAGKHALDAAGLQRFLAVDLAFHMIVLRAAGNHRILKTVADSRVLSRIFRTQRQQHEVEVVEKTYRYHAEILQALQQRDGEAARRIIAEHIRASKQESLDCFDRQNLDRESPFPLGLPADIEAELKEIERGLGVGSSETLKSKPNVKKQRAKRL